MAQRAETTVNERSHAEETAEHRDKVWTVPDSDLLPVQSVARDTERFMVVLCKQIPSLD